MNSSFFKTLKLTFTTPLLVMVCFLVACNAENLDSASEYSCSQADGLWTVMAASCDGVDVDDVAPATYVFDQESGSVAQTIGRVDCTKTYNWLVEVGEQTAIFSMTASGNLTCTESGQDVSFCSSELNSCNSAINVAGLKNEYPTCVIASDGMSLVRSVSAVNNPDNFSYCEDGQQEVVTLVQGEYVPPGPDPEPDTTAAFIEVAGPNPLDFGTHSIGSRIPQIITLTNSGSGLASSLDASGLASPYLFLGGSYPGVGGTCDSSLELAESCTVIVEFFPSVAGYFTDNLLIKYNNGKGSVSLTHGLAGTASQSLAQLKISDGPYYNFGSVVVGSVASFQFTVSNNGGGDALALFNTGLAAPFSYTGGAYPGTSGDCGITLASGSDCVIDIEFAPTVSGPFNGTIEVNYLDGVNILKATRNVFGLGRP